MWSGIDYPVRYPLMSEALHMVARLHFRVYNMMPDGNALQTQLDIK
jgi:hypothetical protein